jgi:8-oxo-dGTP pyrophosphatase MutT (NUDIX family)
MKNRTPVGTSTLNVEMLLDILRATAVEGLSYSENPYDRARYQKLLDLTSEQYASITGRPPEAIREMFLREHGSITPKVGVDIAVPNHNGEILILQLPNGEWCLPGGWMDVGESPFVTARREAREETGLHIAPLGIITIGHLTPLIHAGEVSQVNICVGAQPLPNDAEVTVSHEHTAYRWISDVSEVEDWRPGHKRFFARIFRAYQDQAFFPMVNDHE